jgi:tellurite resistance protein TerC
LTPLSYWLWFHAALVLLLGVEYVLHLAVPDTRRKAIYATVLWTGAALALAAVLVPHYRAVGAQQYLAGYALEESLSIDNLFVFLLLFKLRGAFIAGGLGLLARFAWISYVFAAILLLAAIRLLKPEDQNVSETPQWITWLTRLRPISEDQNHFFVREAASAGAAPQRMMTVLFLALVAVELTDIVFALDSIPAVLSITRDPFLAYSSNIMAVMGLRSLYVLLAAMLSKLRFLHFGLAAILAFAALKMLAARWIDVGPLASLAVIGVLLAVTIGVSLLAPAKDAAV